MNSILAKMYERVRKENSKRTTRFIFVALCVMMLNGSIDFIQHLQFSGTLIFIMAFFTAVIFWFSYKNYTKFIIPAIVVIINTFLVLIAFAEGLKTGSYLYILPVLFALAFLMGSEKVNILEMSIYFFITACCFCTCILFCDNDGNWQNINPQLSQILFKKNGITVSLLCSVFAGMGVYFEKQYKLALIEEKNKAEVQEMMIKGQNKHLEEIAFTTSHVIRKPLANILALADMLNSELITDAHIKEVITHLETSTHRLDEAVKDIVIKTQNNFRQS